MAEDFIAIEVKGIEELRREFGNWPDEIQDSVVNAANNYVLTNIRKYPEYAYVPFKTAYGGWFSDKQRKYVMARIREGDIVPGVENRSHAFMRAWKIVGYGKESFIANEMAYASYLMGDETQSRMMAKIGWSKMGAWIEEHLDAIVAAARAGLVKALSGEGEGEGE